MSLSPEPPILNPASIGVIVGKDLVGDALIKLPFLRALRNAFPKAEINWITSQGTTAYATILRDATRGLINVIYEQPVWLDKPAQAPHFDIVMDTRNRWREALQARRLPHRLFLALAFRFLFSEKRPPLLQDKSPHMVDRLLQLVELAAGYKPVSTGALPVRQDLVQMARRILPEGQTYVGLATGAGNRVKVWPRYKFEMLAELQATKGHTPVFILGPQEQADFTALTAVIPTAKFPLQDIDVWGAAPLTIDHTLAIASLLDVAVANDSGVGHMLAAVDCPLISLFGPTSPEKLAPRVTRGVIIRAQDFDSDSERMKDITWEAVDQAIDKLLGSTKG